MYKRKLVADKFANFIISYPANLAASMTSTYIDKKSATSKVAPESSTTVATATATVGAAATMVSSVASLASLSIHGITAATAAIILGTSFLQLWSGAFGGKAEKSYRLWNTAMRRG